MGRSMDVCMDYGGVGMCVMDIGHCLTIPLTSIITSPVPTSLSPKRPLPSFFHQYALAYGVATQIGFSTTNVMTLVSRNV